MTLITWKLRYGVTSGKLMVILLTLAAANTPGPVVAIRVCDRVGLACGAAAHAQWKRRAIKCRALAGVFNRAMFRQKSCGAIDGG